MPFLPQDITEIHVELTTRCNARCPQCARNIEGGPTIDALPLTELRLDDVREILTPAHLARLRKIMLCGNYGDPIIAVDALEIIEYMRAHGAPRLQIGMHTNGSARRPGWWARLAPLLSYCRFGVDGLEDTNALYRRGTRWSKIMANAAAFIAAGGRAEWDFIVFRHNEHQVEEARALSRGMGFAAFHVKRTHRFAGAERAPVRDLDGSVAYHLEPPLDAALRNPSTRRKPTDADLESAPIACKAFASGSVYLSAEGFVLPCCYVAQLYTRWRSPEQHELRDAFAALPGGLGSLCATEHGLDAVVEGPFFQTLLPERWQRETIAEGRPRVCARVCGGGREAYDLKTVRARERA